jgi:hypothetical protein
MREGNGSQTARAVRWIAVGVEPEDIAPLPLQWVEFHGQKCFPAVETAGAGNDGTENENH